MLLLTLFIANCAFAYSFSAVNNGQTIYYNITSSNTVEVTNNGINSYTGTIEIPATVTDNSITYNVTAIGNDAFEYCSGLTSITIPNSVTTIGNYAFSHCTDLTSVDIGNSVTNIGNEAFYHCIGLTSITIPNSVTNIGYYAFSHCTDLTDIVVDPGNLNYSSVGGVLFNKLQDILIQYPAGKTGNYNIQSSVTTIGIYAFAFCTGLTSVDIPNSVTTIGDFAFYHCTGLTSVTIPNSVTTIGNGAFYYCIGLTSVDIPNSVTTIGNGAFGECYGLTSVDIGNSVTTIGNDAFYSCIGLTSVDIPNSVTTIGDYAFYDCTSLTSVDIGNSVTTIGDYAFYDCTSLTSVDIPNSVTTIGYAAFERCTGLTSVDIGNSVTTIGDFAFYYCTGLTSVDIPNSVTTIGNSAFERCTDLTSVDIGNSVTTIGNYAFSNCTDLTSITNLNPVPQNITYNDVFANVVQSHCTLTVPTSSINAYLNAEVWQDFAPIAGGGLLFSARAVYPAFGRVTSNIPDGLYPINTSITITANLIKGSFLGWTGGGVDLGSDNSLSFTLTQDTIIIANFGIADTFDITKGTLKDQPNIKDLTYLTITGNIDARDVQFMRDSIPYLTELDLSGATIVEYTGAEGTDYYGNYPANEMPRYSFLNPDTWTGKTSLVSVKMPDGLTSIGELAFAECSGLTSVTIPNSVTAIGNYAFYYCTGLTSVDIGNSVITIGEGAFYYCYGLTSVDIPNSVTTIGNSAFYNCTGLTSVDIGNSVTTIGYDAFYYCTGLTEIYVRAETPPSLSWSVFWGVPTNIPVYVPCESFDDYSASGWGSFSNIIELLYLTYNITLHSSNPVIGAVRTVESHCSDSTVTIIAEPDDLFRFKQWNDNITDSQRTIKLTQDTVFTAEFEAAITIKHTNGIVYVTQSGSGYGDGSSWADAYCGLAAPLKYAELHNATAATGDSIKQIWVAAGTYYPEYKAAKKDNNNIPTTYHYQAFVLAGGVKVYGGFAGDEAEISQRDIKVNETILSGDIDKNNTLDGNVYHVVISAGNNVNTAVLDGFTITGGYQSTSSYNNIIVNGEAVDGIRGAGIYNYNSSPALSNLVVSYNVSVEGGGGIYNKNSSPTLTNIIISNNHTSDGRGGGGIYNKNSSPVLTNVIIKDNTATGDGGGIYNENSSPELINVIIRGNTIDGEDGGGGGGIINYNSSSVLINTLVSGNYAPIAGGGIANVNSSSLVLINSTVSGNYALGVVVGGIDVVGGIYNDHSSIELTNSIVWGNNGDNVFNESSIPVYSHSLVQGSGGSGGSWNSSFGTDSGNNIDIDPLFVEPQQASAAPTSLGDYRLQFSSPAINVGDSMAYFSSRGVADFTGEKDLAGEPRKVGNNIDMGAYENQIVPVIEIIGEPSDTTVIEGAITGELRVTASVNYYSVPLVYQWHSTDAGGTAIAGATGTGYTIPTGLQTGTYYYYVTINAIDAVPVTSRVAKVTVKAIPTAADLQFTPTGATYNGSAQSVTVSAKDGVVGMGSVTVKYNGTTQAPTAADTYVITVDVAEGTNYTAATGISLGNFVIGKKTPVAADLQFTPTGATYNGSAQSVTVSVKDGIDGMGSVTAVKYNGTTQAPTAADTYAITVDVAAGTNYAAATGISLGNFVIARATQSAPATPTLASKTSTSVTLNAITGAEYRNGTTGVWQDSPKFEGLTPDVEYIFYARMKETATHEASPASEGLSVTTNPTPTYGISLTPSGNHTFADAVYGYGEQTAHSLTVVNVGNQPTGDLTIALSGTNSSSFTLSKTGITSLAADGSDNFTLVPKTGLAPDTYVATLTISGGNGISAGFDISFTVNRATQSAPATPTLASKTSTSVTLNAITGAEYRNGTTDVWQDSLKFEGLTPDVEYTFYARMKETATHEASPASEGLSVTTNPTPTYGISLTPSGNHSFADAVYGYGEQTAHSLTVANVGNQPSGDLTIALSGTNSSSFTLSKTGITSLAADGSDNFTLVPKTGLAPGTYVATLTISGGNGISAGFDISFTVSRATQSAPAAPTLASKTSTSVTLNAITDAEYRNGTTGVWQDSPKFEGLTPNVEYTFYARMKETATHEASPASEGLSVTTNPTPAYGISLTPSGNHTFADAVYGYGEQTAHSLTVANVGNQPTGDLTIALSGTNSSSFTLSKTGITSLAVGGIDNFTLVPKTGLAVGEFLATVTISGGNGISAGFDISFTVSRATQSAPAAPTLASKTSTSVTLNTITGAEYRNGTTGVWQDSPTFGGLSPDLEYTFYARMKETATHEASPASEGLSVTTNPTPAYGISLTPSGNHSFAGAVYGYGEQTAHSLTVANVGNQPSGDLTITLSGANSSSFTLSKTAIDNLASGANDSFTVTANTGLTPAVYVATITISGDNDISVTFDVSFTVNKASQQAPDVPTLADRTGTSVTLTVIPDAEYRNGTTGVWQDSPTFEGLAPNIEYTFYARMKETATHEASPASEALTAMLAGVDADLINLVVNGETVSIVNNESEYRMKCDETSVTLDIEISPTATVKVNGSEYDRRNIPLTGLVTTIEIQIVSGDGQTEYSYRLKVMKTLDAHNMLYQRWDDVLIVNRNPANNDGIDSALIDGVRWYLDGAEVAIGNTTWFIRLAYPVERYHAEININGNWHLVCGTPQKRNTVKIIAYPNPVSAGDILRLQLPDSFVGGYADVINLSGTTVKRKLPLPDAVGIIGVINVSDLSPGIYLLKIVSPAGNSETVKIIVN